MENLDDALRLAAEMRAGLEGVTSGPWEARQNLSDRFVVEVPDLAETVHTVSPWSARQDRADAAHIARCSPENIRLLLDTIDTLRRERDEAADGLDYKAIAADHREFISQLKAERETASATITAQAAEIARWRRQSDDWQSRGWEMGQNLDAAESTVERLKAEIARKDAARDLVEEASDLLFEADAAPYDTFETDADWALHIKGKASKAYAVLQSLRAALQPTETPATVAHPDDLAVDRFAAAMKAKLAKKRAEGRGGWDRKIPVPGLDGRGFSYECPNSFLSQLLREHVGKGDPVDVGNLAMMIHQRGERIAPTLTQSGAGEPVVKALVTSAMVNAAWNEGKTRRMTGLPNDFRAVLEATLSPSPPQETTR